MAMGRTHGRLRGGLVHRRVASSGFAAVLALPLLVLLSPGGGSGTARMEPTAGVSAQVRTQDSTAIVPNVVSVLLPQARATLQAAGFVVDARPGFVDCGPQYVQQQTPPGGTSAALGSTVQVRVNRQPGPGQPCP
jgi:hypothetical protein